ncbi:hypothetical protein HRV97_02925 [Sphingomonas sp. HHU CXW]|uniref:Alginate biosynthesis protein AlgP n=1 Tax=Sphingomonas hominis TaxID=2741495 RepID=A0ABX2JCR2_9SPHN|nr:hypothetical protein [Sphingomonas hominis]NTS64113.1 hypothetical protein [Sphingomonas hominis]
MADESDTPTPPQGNAPATPRRRAPRKAAAPKSTATKAPTKPTEAAPDPTAKPAPKPAKAPPKPRSSKRSTPKPAAKPRAPATKRVTDAVADAAHDVSEAVTAAEERAAKITKTAARRTRASARKAGTSAAETTEKVAGKWGAAKIAGGVAVLGAAATAALLSLRGSSRSGPTYKPALLPNAAKEPQPATPTVTAHQPDGTDSSKSFEAGSADENTIPDA